MSFYQTITFDWLRQFLSHLIEPEIFLKEKQTLIFDDEKAKLMKSGMQK